MITVLDEPSSIKYHKSMTSLEEYRQAVEYLAKEKMDFDIHNEGNDCAKVIFANIFVNAKQTVRIVANTLRNEVVDSPDYQDALDSFLSNEKAELKIIINHLPENAKEDSVNNIYRRLHRHPSYLAGRIQIREAGRDMFHIGDKPANFCVADGTMSRIERDVVKRNALCNFGNKDRAVKLEEIFDRGFSSIQNVVDLNQLFS